MTLPAGFYKYDRSLASLLMVCFFLPMHLQVIILIAICLFFATRDAFVTLKQNLRNQFPAVLILGSFYLLYIFWLPFTPTVYRPELYFQLEQKISILLLPVTWLLLQSSTRQLIYRQLWVFVVGCIVSCTWGNLLYLFHSEDMESSHVFYRLFFEGATGIHPTYMGMYLCFSIGWLLLHQQWCIRLRGWLIAIVYVVLFLFLFALLPKAPCIALFIILVHNLYKNRKQTEHCLPVIAAFFSAMLIAYLLIPFSTQRIGEITTSSVSSASVADNSMNMRKLIWRIDKDLVTEHWLTGVGPGAVPATLSQKYFYYSLIMRYPIGIYDTHNQYVNQWLSFGIIGLLLFIGILGFQWIKAIMQKDVLFIYLLITLTVTFSTENVLSNQRGIIFYAFFTALSCFLRKQPTTDIFSQP